MSAQAPQPAQQSEPSRGLTLAYLIVLLVIISGVWGVLVVNLWNLDPHACLSLTSKVPGAGFVAAGIVGLLLGRYSGALRYIAAWDVEYEEEGGARSNAVGRTALIIIFAALVLIFIYEAIGVYEPPNGLEPITYYVRCSIAIDDFYGGGIRSLLIILLISFLFGQWLWAWHPDQNAYRGQLRKRLGDLFTELKDKKLWDEPQLRKEPAARRRRLNVEDHRANQPGA